MSDSPFIIQSDRRGIARAISHITSNFQFREIDAAMCIMVKMVSMVATVVVLDMVVVVDMVAVMGNGHDGHGGDVGRGQGSHCGHGQDK